MGCESNLLTCALAAADLRHDSWPAATQGLYLAELALAFGGESMATEVAVRVKVGVKVGRRDRVSLLLLRLPLAAQSLHTRVAAVVARRRGGGSGGATPAPPSRWPPRDRPLRLLPSPSNFPLKPLSRILARSQAMGLIIQQLKTHTEGGS